MPVNTELALDSDETELTDGAEETPEASDENIDAAAESTDTSSEAAESDGEEGSEPKKRRQRINWQTTTAYVILPLLIVLLAAAAGFLKWQDTTARSSQQARAESLATAKEAIVALLSYKPNTVEKDLSAAAQDKLTGPFKDSYSQLVHDIVIPGSQSQRISAAATVPAAATVSASPSHAVVLLFINQTVVVGDEAPSDSASSVRVTLDKVGNRWRVAGFEPV